MTETGSGPAKGGLMDDLIEAIVAPVRAFERRRDGRYGLLLVVLTVLTGVIMVATMGLSQPYWDAQFDLAIRQAADKGQAMPPEATGEAARTFGRWAAVIGAALFTPIFVWIGALFVMLGGKLAGASIGYRQGAAIFTLAGVPRLLSPIAMALQGLVVSPDSVRSISDASLGPARFMDPATTPPAVMSLLSNFDAVNLWAFALVAIGISVIGRVSRGSGFVGTAIVFAGVLALSLIPAAFA
jgi:hypothetical protein